MTGVYLGSGERHAHSVLDLQEADVSVLVASDKGEKYDVAFLPLEVVHHRHTHAVKDALLWHHLSQLEQLT